MKSDIEPKKNLPILDSDRNEEAKEEIKKPLENDSKPSNIEKDLDR